MSEVAEAPAILTAIEEMEQPKFEFDGAFQSKIAALVVRDTQFMQRVDGLIRPEYFESGVDAAWVSVCMRYYLKYKRVPADKTIYARLLKEDLTAKIIDPVMMTHMARYYQDNILKADLSDRDFVVDEVATFARHQAVSAAILQSVTDLDRRDFERISKSLRKALDVGANQDGDIYDFGENVEARTGERLDRAAGKLPPQGITTGYPMLNDCLYHKGWGRRELSVIMGGAKAGKCVTRDTTIFTEDGMVEIGDYVPASLPPDSFAPHVMSVLGRAGLEQTSHVYSSGVNPTIRVKTHRGFEIEGTRHHPMLVLRDGQHVWKRLDELQLGDQMAVQRGAMVFGRHTDLGYAVDAANARVASSARADATKSATFPRTMTPDLAEFLGMFIAEGYCTDLGCFTFTQQDEAILSRFATLASSLFGIAPGISRQDDKVASVRLSSVAVRAYLEALGVVWGLSAVKTVPRSIRRAPEDCVRAFLSALVGLECHVDRRSEGKVSFDLVMASEKLIKQVQLMLLNFGIVSRRTLKPSMATNGSRIVRDYWRLIVSGSRNVEALAQLGVYEPRKDIALAGVRVDSTARDWIPGSQHLVGDVMLEVQAAGHPLKSTFSQSGHRSLRTFRSGRQGQVRELTFAFAESLTDRLDGLGVRGVRCTQLRDIVDTGYCYDPVVSIEEGEADTVDLTVPGTHSFFANGLVSHNTTALLDFAIQAVNAHHNVLYVTLEVSAKILAERCDANMSQTRVMDLQEKAHDVKAKVKSFMTNAGARLVLKEFPTGSATVSDLRRLIERFKSRGLTFDMVVVDYADIMAPERYTDNQQENSKSVYVGLRGLAMAEDFALLTATQTNREGFKATVAKAEHVADDFNKIRIADIIISINRTPEELAAGQARLYFAASRNQPGNFTIRIEQQLDQMRFITKVIGHE